MRQKLFFAIVFSTTLAILGVYFYAPGDVASQRTLGALNAERISADGKVPATIAKPKLPEVRPADSQARIASGDDPQVARWPTIVPEFLKKSLQATASRRPPIPPTSPDAARKKAGVEAGKQQESSKGAAKKTNALHGVPTISGIPLRCNVKRPSCRRWLHLQQKKKRRKNTLAVR